MNKLNLFLADHATKIIIVLAILIYAKACSVDSELERVKKDLRATNLKIDSLNSQMIDASEMREIIKDTPAWNTLRIEEMSDKEKISINAVKAIEEGYGK